MSLRFALFPLALLLAPPALAQAESAVGTWTNPKGSIEVRTRRCGDQLCGTIVSANAKARAKAAKAGVTQLVGTEILSNYRRDGAGWTGTLFVPDKGRRVSSHMALQGPDKVTISGCLIGLVLCKTQVWTRTDGQSVAAR